MTDPELQALAEPMFDALMDRKPLDRRAQADICAQVAIDHFAARLARADAIEQAAEAVITATNHYTLLSMTHREIRALRAALEAS